MNDKQYFVMYTNYPVIDNKEKHIKYCETYDFRDVWGMTYNINYLRQRFILDSNEIEKQRNLLFQEVMLN